MIYPIWKQLLDECRFYRTRHHERSDGAGAGAWAGQGPLPALAHLHRIYRPRLQGKGINTANRSESALRERNEFSVNSLPVFLLHMVADTISSAIVKI